jgi:hypothetical protein
LPIGHAIERISEMNSICVFCGAHSGGRPIYEAMARELGRAIAGRGIRLVYGGDKVGLMGEVADAALAAGGAVVGVIPRRHAHAAHPGVSQMFVVESLHERKAKMAELSDGFIALPGGYGTLEEFAEAVTWGQLGYHRKPTALLNVASYFDALLTFLDHAVVEGFVRPEYRPLVISHDSPALLLDALAAWTPTLPGTW